MRNFIFAIILVSSFAFTACCDDVNSPDMYEADVVSDTYQEDSTDSTDSAEECDGTRFTCNEKEVVVTITEDVIVAEKVN